MVELGLKRDKGFKRDVTCGSDWALTKIISEPSAILGRYDPFILQVTLVPHKDDLGIIPGVGFDLSGPVELWTLRRRLKVGGGGESKGLWHISGWPALTNPAQR